MTNTRETRVFSRVLVLAGLLLAMPAIAQRRDLAHDNVAYMYRGQDGKRITVVCAPRATYGGVWGTDVYTDDSSICGAALHAGVINAAEGGAVTAVITASRTSYEGSERNGIASRSFQLYYGSITVEKGDGGEIDWTTKAAGLESATGPLAVVCPATGKTSEATVWGSDIYSDDTPVCVAAVHAGVITPRGGRVVIEAAPGRTSYRGTSRNGVQSRNYTSWPRSFRFEGVEAEAEAPVATITSARTTIQSQPSSSTIGSGSTVSQPTVINNSAMTEETLVVLKDSYTMITPTLTVIGTAFPLNRSFTSSPLVIMGTAFALSRSFTTPTLVIQGQ